MNFFFKKRFLPQDTCFHDSGMPPSQNQSKQGSAIPDKPAQAATGISAPSLAGTPRGAHPHAEAAQSLLLGRGQRGQAGGWRNKNRGCWDSMSNGRARVSLFAFYIFLCGKRTEVASLPGAPRSGNRPNRPNRPNTATCPDPTRCCFPGEPRTKNAVWSPGGGDRSRPGLRECNK